MLRSPMTRRLIPLICSFALACGFVMARSAPPESTQAQLKFVVILTRHGVRSPTGKASRYDAYSAAPWPAWNVPPGDLTAHGFALMKLFGAYDRASLAAEGLLAPDGCADATRVSIVADSDERTRETGRALSEGMFPGCDVAVQAGAEDDPDPLFHPVHAGLGAPDPSLALAAVAGSIGGDAGNLTEAYYPQLEALDHLLAGCGRAPVTNAARRSILDVPVAQGAGDHASELRGPLSVASSMAETLLLEYAEGMKGEELGWGCLDEGKLREIMQLHAAEAEITDRTPAIARMNGSNLLAHILDALEENARGKAVQGAPGKPGDRVLFLVGHDTNIASVAGLLDLHWIIDGRRDDTPPGGALTFELWRSPDGTSAVRLYYTAQTLLEMREATPLSLANPPQRVPVFVPGCGRPDMSCSLDSFATTVRRVVDPAYVRTGSADRSAASLGDKAALNTEAH